MSRAQRDIRPLAVLAAVLLLSCSTRKLAYEWGAGLLLREVDAAFDLRPEQKDFLRPRLHEHFRWHRHSELPLYARRVEELRVRLQRGLSEEDLRWLRAAVEEAGTRLGQRLAPDAGALLATLTPAQVDRFERQADKRSRKRYEHFHLAPQPYATKRAAELEKSLSSWVGPLTPAQRELCVQHFLRLQKDALLRRELVQRQLRELVALVRQRAPAERLAQAVQATLLREAAPRTEEERAAVERLEAGAGALALQLFQQATPAQRHRLDSELASLRDDLLDLSRHER